MSNHSPLVGGHLEDVSIKLFDQHPEALKAVIGARHGLYVLYRKERLYYVGLATNLYRRLVQHRRDKHRGQWDRFSAYLTRRERQVKELESLALRILMPPGNRRSGRFARSTNLKGELADNIDEVQREHKAALLGGPWQKRRRRKAASGEKSGPELLAVLSGKRRKLWGQHLGQDYEAVLLRNGWIRLGGYDYPSPSKAAEAATGHRLRGWSFWHYNAGNGEWLRLQELRRR